MWQSVKNIFHAFVAGIALIVFNFPSRKLKVVGVTGTDGKTTTTHLIHHILKYAGFKSAMISSVYADIGGKKYDTGFHVTTPNSWFLQKLISQAVKKHDEFLILEVTSHGLDQNRVWGINFNVGVLTNVTHEHLDYHVSYLDYLRSKEKLLKTADIAIVNKDDDSYHHLDLKKYHNPITYSLTQDADINLKKFPLKTKLPGEFNLYNCLAAFAVCRQLGVPDKKIFEAVAVFEGVQGRFDIIKCKQDFKIIVDFAHTPNAFDQVLPTAKKMVKNRLIHIFGAAGLRDSSKRMSMGQKSALYADIIVLTEEDYRTEDVNLIISQIAAGCQKQGAAELKINQVNQIGKNKYPVFMRIPDRQKAINFTIQKLGRAGDVLLFTGKAHEKSLCRGKIEYPWDEFKAISSALAAMKPS